MRLDELVHSVEPRWREEFLEFVRTRRARHGEQETEPALPRPASAD